ncbi:ParB/RepB/Spo0J family partition protein [Nocardia transvalensis]|uniref:ParB/RepB/Spo0J family partition protein n=1 Tax=Nocardia transvalensis TaxID=37333 RepID=UPI0018940ED3|nr:ParB/RepB/Spo0J family partition protein [Nocardia transvalensis]MBF6331889.1 ParB/RepB/Spo0J family partition protein [Nocardia transvalensis]
MLTDTAVAIEPDSTSDPTVSTTETDSTTTSDGAVPPKAEAVYLDPAELEIAENVRQSFRLEDYPEYTDSIREHGVFNPIKAIRMPDGRIVVRDGQVRTLTALAFEQPRVPVWLLDADDTVSDKELEIARIVEQITVNDRRIALTDGDRAAGIALALDLGASVTRIGKALQTKRDEIKLAGKVGASPTARHLVDDGQFDLEQAALIAEYETVGDTDAVQRLTNCIRSYFTYEAKKIAADRDEQRIHLTAARPYAEAGFGVLTDYPYTDAPDATLVPATELVDADGVAVAADRIHADPSGWLVWLELDDQPLLVETDTGVVVDPDTVDWATARDPERTPQDGMRHANQVDQRDNWLAEYFLPVDALAAANLSRTVPADNDSNDESPASAEHSTDTADDELAARRRADAEARAAAAREEQRLALRRVRELNKQGVAAMQARREFVTRLLARKTLPTQAVRFITDSLIADPGLLSEYNALDTAVELLALTGQGYSRQDLRRAIETAKPARCQVILLGLVLGGYEKRTAKDCWRYADRGVKRYLTFLREQGHQLVPVELAALGEVDSDHIDIDTPAAEPQAA